MRAGNTESLKSKVDSAESLLWSCSIVGKKQRERKKGIARNVRIPTMSIKRINSKTEKPCDFFM
tara:strand:- start:1879 stop:2070 length:192 start_codon:yes stop_codon:yes gene_type:complete